MEKNINCQFDINCQFTEQELLYILDGLRMCEMSFIDPKTVEEIKQLITKIFLYYEMYKKEEGN